MRLVSGVVALTLFASLGISTARAEDTTASEPARSEPAHSDTAPVNHAKIPLRVVRVMPESHQALLFDRARSTHVLAEVGHVIDGYSVDAIDDDEVTLSRDGKQIVLAAPVYSHHRDREAAATTGFAPAGASGARGSDIVTGDPSPVDPYGDAGIRVAHASGPAAASDAGPAGATRALEPGDGGVRVAIAPDGAAASIPAGPAGFSEPLPALPGIRVAEAPGGSRAPHGPARTAALPATEGGTEVRVASAAAPGVPVADASPAASEPRSVSAAPSTSVDARPTATPAAAAPRSVSVAATGDARPNSAARPDSAAPGGALDALPSPAPTAAAPRTVSAAPTAAIEARPAAGPTSSPAASATGDTTPATSAASAAVAVRPATTSRGHTRGAAAPTGDKQTRDASELADILSNDSGRRQPKMPAIGNADASADSAAGAPTSPASAAPGPTAPSEPHRVTAASEIRTARPAGDAIVLPRAEVDAALADFTRLATSVHGSFGASGFVLDQVDAGSLLQRAGLRTGDVITAIDGVRLRSLDDAANLYARAASAQTVSAQVVRRGKPVTIHVSIQ